MKLIIDISEKDYLECVKKVEEIREKGYMIENLKYKIIITDGTPLEEELEKIKTKINSEDIDCHYEEDYVYSDGLQKAIEIIDKEIAELKGETNE